MATTILDGLRAMERMQGAPGMQRYDPKNPAVEVENYTYQNWLDAHKKWHKYAQSGLVTDEQELLAMMREVAKQEMLTPQVPLSAPEGEQPRAPADLTGATPIGGPDTSTQFVRCSICMQPTPNYVDCTFCGAPTPGSAALREYLVR